LWIAAVAKLMRRRWTGIVLHVKDETCVERKRICGRCRWENDIQIFLREFRLWGLNSNKCIYYINVID
jgi:hypothetical protein